MIIRSCFTFRPGYLLLTVLLFVCEVFIALYVKDNFVRPYAGDFLVVIMLYTFLMSFIEARSSILVLAVLLLSYVIEALQYFCLLERLQLQKSQIANIVLGNFFTWNDMMAYTLGAITIFVAEKLRQLKMRRKQSKTAPSE